MAKIILVVGEHPEESPFTVKFAKEVAKRLQAYGNTVAFSRVPLKGSAQDLSIQLVRLLRKHSSFQESEPAALKLITRFMREHYQDGLSSREFYLPVRESLARRKHVFSFHAIDEGCLGNDVGLVELLPGSDALVEIMRVLNANRKRRSVIAHARVGGRVAGYVESAAEHGYRDYRYAGRPRSLLGDYLRALHRPLENKVSRAQRYFLSDFTRRLNVYAKHSGTDSYEFHAQHADNVARELHKLVTSADGKLRALRLRRASQCRASVRSR